MTLDTTPDRKIVLAPKRRYTLAELLAQCDLSVPPSADLAAWDNAPPVGRESI